MRASLKEGVVVSAGINEVVAFRVLVGKFQRFAVDLDQFDFFGRGEAYVAGLAGLDRADDRLDERAQVAGRAVGDFQHHVDFAVVTDGLAFAEIVCCCHKERGMG